MRSRLQGSLDIFEVLKGCSVLGRLMELMLRLGNRSGILPSLSALRVSALSKSQDPALGTQDFYLLIKIYNADLTIYSRLESEGFEENCFRMEGCSICNLHSISWLLAHRMFQWRSRTRRWLLMHPVQEHLGSADYGHTQYDAQSKSAHISNDRCVKRV